MSHKAFYRKYRPCCFNDIIGQNHIITTLKNAIKLNRINHAYIFCGPKGIGKTSIAKIFARAVNCLHPIDGDICQECENCKLANTDMDILELDAASNNGVDDVRKIISNVQFRPMQLKYKVYIVDEAHMLSVAAWNSFLKTIEESPEYAIFIFATTEMHKIPSTVVSRCQYFQF
jgi:DNA polymerase-3 subunit gamma/tau